MSEPKKLKLGIPKGSLQNTTVELPPVRKKKPKAARADA